MVTFLVEGRFELTILVNESNISLSFRAMLMCYVGFQLISLHISNANNNISSSLYQLPTYTTQGMLGVVSMVGIKLFKTSCLIICKE
jgi:hypothetical protein